MYEPLAQRRTPTAGSFAPVAVAVEESTHHVYVVDGANNMVDEFDDTGKQTGTIGLPLVNPTRRQRKPAERRPEST